MRAQPNRQEDKKYLKKLTQALDVSEGRIHLDGCGDWNIVGTRGYIHTDTDYWYLYTQCDTDKKWMNTKKALSFMEVHQDGDSEGIMKLARMPFREEARAVRKVIGLRPRTVLTEEQRAVLLRTSYKRDKQGVYSDSMRLNEKDDGRYVSEVKHAI